MPAFQEQGPAVVTFSISPYNSNKTINRLHVSLVNQSNNKNAFYSSIAAFGDDTTKSVPDGTNLLNGIWIIPFNQNEIPDCLSYNDDYSVCTLKIPATFLKETSTFLTDNYYKLQLRFDNTSTSIGILPGTAGTDSSGEEVTTSDYMLENRGNFSEWSSVSLIKAIPAIGLRLNLFGETWYRTLDERDIQAPIGTLSNTNPPPPALTPGNIILLGDMKYGSIDSENGSFIENTSVNSETLQSYRIIITDEHNTETIFDSGRVYSTDFYKENSFTQILDLHKISSMNNIDKRTIFKFKIEFTTKNQFSGKLGYDFTVQDFDNKDFWTIDWSIGEITLDQYNTNEHTEFNVSEDGIVNITVKIYRETEKNHIIPKGYLFLRRASSIDNFENWELIECSKFDDGAMKIEKSFTDRTVGSLVRYKYSCQYLAAAQGIGTPSTMRWSPLFESDEIYPDFYDILLSRQNKQLAVRYNPQITSYAPVVNRQKIDTLGGKYPRFAENAKMNYKKFTINGLISAEADFNRRFLDDNVITYRYDMEAYDIAEDGKYMIRNDTLADGVKSYTSARRTAGNESQQAKRDVAGDWLSLNYENTHDIYPMDNWYWERTFREEVLSWLNDGEPKLLRSMTEGNIIVMITDVTLTPNAQLGRRLYSFSATAYEIGDGYSLDDLASLGVITVKNDYMDNLLQSSSSNVSGDPSNPDAPSEDDNKDDGGIPVSTVGQIWQKTLDKGKGVIYYTPSTGTQSRITEIIDNRPSVVDWSYDDVLRGDYYAGIFSQLGPKPWSDIGSTDDKNNNGYQYHLTDVKIQFESLPQWYYWARGYGDTGLNPNQSSMFGSKVINAGADIITLKQEDAPGMGDSNNDPYAEIGLGYKLGLVIRSSIKRTEKEERIVFVNEKGYYQVPSDIVVYDVYLYDGAQATIDFKIDYKIYPVDDLAEISSTELRRVYGQISGPWSAGTSLYNYIAEKEFVTYLDDKTGDTLRYTDYFSQWSGAMFDVDPYTIIRVQYFREEGVREYTVGRTGVLNLMSDYRLVGATILGRKMFQVESDRAGMIDSWEFILDDSANGGTPYKDTSRIHSPQYNTVYGIANGNEISYKLYFLDEGWYNISPLTEDLDIILALVPVYGMINYKGTIIERITNTDEEMPEPEISTDQEDDNNEDEKPEQSKDEDDENKESTDDSNQNGENEGGS